MTFMICVTREGFGEFDTGDLTLGRVYEALEPINVQGMVRIVDDSGDDYLYPAILFEPVSLSAAAAKRLHAVIAG